MNEITQSVQYVPVKQIKMVLLRNNFKTQIYIIYLSEAAHVLTWWEILAEDD